MRARERRLEGPNNPLHWYGPIGEAPEFFPDARTWTLRDLRWGTRDDARTESIAEVVGCDAQGSPCVVDERLDCGLWRVSTYGAASLRTGTNGLSLNHQQLLGDQPMPNGSSLVQRPLPLWVEIGTINSNKRRFRVDAGQTIFVYGAGVNVRLWMPGPESTGGGEQDGDPSWVDLGTNPGHVPVVEWAQMVSEGLLFCEIARVEASHQQAEQYALLTETYFVDAGEEPGLTRPVPIPAAARQLYAARDDAGVVTATRLQLGFANGIGNTQPLTAVPITDSQSAFAPQILAYATHVLLPILAEPVLWSLCWEIAP